MGISSTKVKLSDWFWGNGKTRNEEPLYTIETGEKTRESLKAPIDSRNGNENTGQYTFGSGNKSAGTTTYSTNKNAAQTGSAANGSIYDNPARQADRKARVEEQKQEVAGPVVYDTRQTDFVTDSQMKTYNNGLSYINGGNASLPSVGNSYGGGTVSDNRYSENARKSGSNTGYGTFVSDSDLLDADGVYKELDVNANNILKNGGDSAYYSEDYLKANAAKNNREKFLKAMNAEERKTYLGLDESRRESYLQSIEPALNQRLGQKEAKFILEHGRDTAFMPGYAFIGGVNDKLSGIGGAFNAATGRERQVAKNPYSYMYQYLRPELSGTEGAISDLAYLFGSELPTAAVSVFNPVAGKALNAITTAGNTYDEAIGRGESYEKALLRAGKDAMLDTAFDKYFDSIPFVSNADNTITKTIKKYGDEVLGGVIGNKNVRDALIDVVAKTGSSYLGGNLEYLADVGTDNIFFGDNIEINPGDMMKSSILNALITDMYNIPGYIGKVTGGNGRISDLPDYDMNNTKADMDLALSLVDSGSRKAQEEYRSTLKDYGFEDTVKTMDSVAEKLGKRVEFGFGDAESADKDTIKIDLKEVKSSKDAVTKVIAGDIAEKVDSERTYKELVSTEKGKRLLNDFAEKEGFSSLEEMRTKIQEKAAEKGKILSDGETDAEVVKKLLRNKDVVNDREGMESIAKASPRLAKDIKEVLSRDKEAFKGTEFEADFTNSEVAFDLNLDKNNKNSYYINKKAEVLAQNREKGKAYEESEFLKFGNIYSEAVGQITIITKSGVRTRVDAIGIDNDGNIVINEFKSSENAPLTNNQRIAFKEIEEFGGTVVGKGKGIFHGGKQIPKGTKIVIVRPKKG